jgi:sugar phosphate isomerase/epimerase
MHRRTVLAAAGAALSQAALAQRRPEVKFGIDLFSIRSQGWNAFEYLDYCARWKAKVVHFSEIRFLGNLEEDHLKKVRAHSEKLGIELEIGMRSVCPSSALFDPKQGTAEEQLTKMLGAARTAGSKLVRAFLGSMADRTGSIPIEGHIENTVKVLRSVRSRAMDSGVKIAIENHAGDMQGRELKTLIEESGKDFVGACIDSGNPLWTIEDPHVTLDVLHPYVFTSHVRDTALWRTPEGVSVAWTRMGEGNVNIDDWVRKFTELCVGKALSMEIIVTQPRPFRYLDPAFWNGYRHTPAWEFARFLSLAERGTPRPVAPPVPKEQAAAREREDLEASIQYTHKLLGI